MPKSYGELVRSYREEAGLTQEELAALSGLGVRTISDIERGRTARPHPSSAERLSRALGREDLAHSRSMRDGPAGPPSSWGLLSVPAMPQVRYSLPADTAAFAGRAGELDQIMAAVAGSAEAGRVVVAAIDGMPGVGKTALAVHAAHVLAGEFPDRQLFIDLHAHTPGREPVTAADALAGLLAAVGVDPRFVPGDLEGRAGMWRDRMAGAASVAAVRQRGQQRAGNPAAARSGGLPGAGHQPPASR